MKEGPHLDRLLVALDDEARGQRALLAGDHDTAVAALRAAATGYRESWELAPPGSYGRLIGMLKAAVLAGDGPAEAAYVEHQLPADAESPPAAYARAIAALITGDDAEALVAARHMRAGSPAFGRTAAAIEALAVRDADAYAQAIGEIVADFEAREEHLTGVPIADTALLLDRLAEPRGLAVHPPSPLLPAA